MVKRYIEKMPKNMNEVGAFVKKRKSLFIGIAVLIVLMIVLLFALQPERSVASFCRMAVAEKPNLKGDKGYEVLLSTFKKLDSVAPDDIRSDTKAIVKGYEIIVSDPSKTIGAEFGIAGSQMRMSDYIKKNCTDF